MQWPLWVYCPHLLSRQHPPHSYQQTNSMPVEHRSNTSKTLPFQQLHGGEPVTLGRCNQPMRLVLALLWEAGPAPPFKEIISRNLLQPTKPPCSHSDNASHAACTCQAYDVATANPSRIRNALPQATNAPATAIGPSQPTQHAPHQVRMPFLLLSPTFQPHMVQTPACHRDKMQNATTAPVTSEPIHTRGPSLLASPILLNLTAWLIKMQNSNSNPPCNHKLHMDTNNPSHNGPCCCSSPACCTNP
jgi:hypothetical protein